MLAENGAHKIDSLTAIKTVVFDRQQASISDLCDALDTNFEGYALLHSKLPAAPKYGNDDERADAVGQRVMAAFTATVARHAEDVRTSIMFECGVATFSWYIGIGEELGASPDGRLSIAYQATGQVMMFASRTSLLNSLESRTTRPDEEAPSTLRMPISPDRVLGIEGRQANKTEAGYRNGQYGK